VVIKSSNAQCISKICSTYLNLPIFIEDATLSLGSSSVNANRFWQQARQWNLTVSELVPRMGSDLYRSDNTTFTTFHVESFFYAAMLSNVYIFQATKADQTTGLNRQRPYSWTKHPVRNVISDDEFLYNGATYIYDSQ
jgi:hypothetical protein